MTTVTSASSTLLINEFLTAIVGFVSGSLTLGVVVGVILDKIVARV
jgi:hypothetical protein